MPGAQALVAWPQSSGTPRVYKSPIQSYSTNLAEGNLTYEVTDSTAEYLNNDEMIIFATWTLPTNSTTILQVWQVGPVSNGAPGIHGTIAANRNAKGTLNLLSGQTASTGGSSSTTRKRNRHGVFVSSSAGNDGPNSMSVTNLAPWLITVGAGTIDRNFPAAVILGSGRRLSGVSLYTGLPLKGKMYPVVYPGKSGMLSASLCMENSLDPRQVRGKIVICDCGSSPRVAKGLVMKKAGGVGMILANGISNGEGLVCDAHIIAACAVGADEDRHHSLQLFHFKLNIDDRQYNGCVVAVQCLRSFCASKVEDLVEVVDVAHEDSCFPSSSLVVTWVGVGSPRLRSLGTPFCCCWLRRGSRLQSLDSRMAFSAL